MNIYYNYPLIDINECKANVSNCDQFCTNTLGSYFCFCGRGYELDTDNHTCIDIDECAVDNGECEQNCHNTDGSYYCSCNHGYVPNDDRHNCDGKTVKLYVLNQFNRCG